jgi:NAD(P)-dependent dehydrogenase (short-subunit alcohol dehydrogenase family)
VETSELRYRAPDEKGVTAGPLSACAAYGLAMDNNRVALVTGASRGLGRACAIELGRAGFRVAVTARTFDESDQRSLPGNVTATAAAVEEAGGQALPVRMDLDDRASVIAGVDEVVSRWGGVDVLVNNAFYQTRESQFSLVDMRMEHLDKQISVNLLAPMFLAKLVLPRMLERGQGAVINMVSGPSLHETNVAAERRPWGIGYGTSKTGMIEIAAMLATQFGDRGILAFSVQPGTVLTEQVAAAMADHTFAADEFTPAEHAAITIRWLATAPEAEALNGGLISAPTFVQERGLLSAS